MMTQETKPSKVLFKTPFKAAILAVTHTVVGIDLERKMWMVRDKSGIIFNFSSLSLATNLLYLTDNEHCAKTWLLEHSGLSILAIFKGYLGNGQQDIHQAFINQIHIDAPFMYVGDGICLFLESNFIRVKYLNPENLLRFVKLEDLDDERYCVQCLERPLEVKVSESLCFVYSMLEDLDGAKYKLATVLQEVKKAYTSLLLDEINRITNIIKIYQS